MWLESQQGHLTNMLQPLWWINDAIAVRFE